MGNHLAQLWSETKNRGESIGIVFTILGGVVLFLQFGLVLAGLRSESGLLGASFGLISVGLGFIAIGMATKSDRRHTELLTRLERNVASLPTVVRSDIIEVAGTVLLESTTKETAVAALRSEASRIAAQRRIDEDAERVGWVRGEVYQLEDGSWGVHWGGKYRL